MDFYVIPPRSRKELMHLGDNRYFCLAQLYLSDPEYKKFFDGLPEDAWVTLDNGAGDHDLVTEDQLFEAMKQLMPNEVIPPDVLFDGDQTCRNAISFYHRMCDENLDQKIEVFFCPQGETQDQWLFAYTWGLEQDWIKTIGLSKIAVPNAWLSGVKGDRGIMESRHNCFNYLKVHRLLKKPLHLLGMGDPREFMYYRMHDEGGFIRSSDSCNSVWSAMNGQNWHRGEFNRIPTPKDYFDLEMEDVHPAMRNIDFLQRSVK